MNHRTYKAHMSKNLHLWPVVLALALGLISITSLHAQQRAGGGVRSSTSSRQYPNAGAIGDAYFSIDPETRRIVTIADEETSKYISQVISNLDRPKPQVLIKVVFLEVQHNNASDIGIEGGWGKTINSDPTTASAVNGFGLSSLSSAAAGTNFNTFGQPLSAFNPVSPMSAQGAGMYQILGTDYQVTLRAIAQAGKARVLSRPSILARNNQPATINVGQSVPLVTSVSYNGLNGSPISAYSYQNVGVILTVTPFITSDGLVEMIVAPEVSSLDFSTTITITPGVSIPVIDVRSANTVAVTPDGQTVVLGGLMSAAKTKTDTKIPFLGDIPLVGNLFRRTQKSDLQTELIIFLTPHIIQAPSQLASLSATETKKSDAIKAFTEEELNKFLDTLPGGVPKSSKPKPASPKNNDGS